MTDKISLSALRELEEKATPGPWGTSGPKVETQHGWKYEREFRPGYNAMEVTCEDGAGVVCAAETDKSCTPHRADAELIAAARNALPALLAIAEAAIEDRAAQEAVNCACLDDMDSEEAAAAFQRGHDADKALAAALALVEG